MSKVKYFLSMSLLILLYNCNNELDIIEEGVDIPVVYGFIDLSDTTQYIRIERAVGEEGTSAFELAKDPDQIYYQGLKVSLVVPSSNNRFDLQRVDGNVNGYVREDGPFALAPNYLYKITSDQLNLVGEEEVQLVLEREGELEVVTSTTNVLEPIEIYDFDRKEIGWFGNNKITLKWSATENSGIFDVKLLIRYSEREGLNGMWQGKELVWNVFSNRVYDDSQRLYQKEKIAATQLYSFLVNNIAENDDLYRRFDDFDVIIKGGAKELIEYRRIILANAGLTGAQELPNYSNINGGLGIFSSKYTVISDNHFFNEPSADTLVERLSNLNFVLN